MKNSKKRKSKPPALSPRDLAAKTVPEEIAPLLESEDAIAAWLKMSEQQRTFFVTWYRNGYNGTQAYLAAYATHDEDKGWDMSENVAAAAAHRLLRNKKIWILRNVLYNAMQDEIPYETLDYVEEQCLAHEDPNVRLRAAKQIRERHAPLLPGEGAQPTSPVGQQFNFFGADLGGLADIINAKKRYVKDGHVQLRNAKQNGAARKGKDSRKR